MFEESLAVTKIKYDYKYLSDMQRNLVCVLVKLVLFMIKYFLLTSDKLEMCTILHEQFNSVFTTLLPRKQVIDPDVFFSVESIAYQADELILTDINITDLSSLIL